MAERIFKDPEVGDVHIVKRLKSKRVTISVYGRRSVKVKLIIPFFVSFDHGLKFYMSKRQWVMDTVARRKAVIDGEACDERPDLDELLRSAEAYLPERTAFLSDKCGLRYRSLTLMNRTTVWGTCSTDNRLRLNIQLMRLPEYLRDFVILHELAHLRHHNHSPEFHDMLENLCYSHFHSRVPAGLTFSQDSKYPYSFALNKELKKYRP